MKKIIITALATLAIAAAALIAVPALAKDASKDQTPVQAAAAVLLTGQTATRIAPVVTLPALTSTTANLYMGYGAAFCGGGLVMNDQVTLQRVATTLGITYDQLVQRLQSGETIAAIATAQKVDLSRVVDTLVAAQTDMVNVLVKYGYVSQEQADTIVANMRTRVEAALSATIPAAVARSGYGCFGNGLNGSVTPSATVPVSGYGYGMMGGRVGSMMGW